MVGEDEDRCTEGRRIPPPYLALVEHPFAHHDGTTPGGRLLDDPTISIGLTAGELA
jgi:hypothetical protein